MGAALLIDALERCYQFSQQIGAQAVVVDAINDVAVSFYKKHGFIPFQDIEDKLFLPMKTIEKALE